MTKSSGKSDSGLNVRVVQVLMNCGLRNKYGGAQLPSLSPLCLLTVFWPLDRGYTKIKQLQNI